VTGLGTDVKVVAIVLQPGEGALAADALDLAARQYSYVMLAWLGAAHVELEAGATAVDADDVHLMLPSSKARSSWRLRAHPGRASSPCRRAWWWCRFRCSRAHGGCRGWSGGR